MRKLALLCLAGLGACGVALAAVPVRPPITSVSHLAVYAGDAVKAEQFYVHDLGAVKRPTRKIRKACATFFATQFVEVLPLPANTGANRMDHIAFNTADAEGMRNIWRRKRSRVPCREQRRRWHPVVLV
jgi:hypothetical protein